jgi:hypothetical protein
VISTFNELPVHDSVNDEIRSFISNHVCIFDRLAPIRQKTFRIPQIPKIASDHTRQLIRFRNNLQRSNRSTSSSNAGQIKAMNKVIKRSINVDTKLHLDCEISQYGIWQVKKRLMKSNVNSDLSYSPDEFNDFFSSVSNEPVTIPCPLKPPSINFNCSFRFSSVNKTFS